MTISKVYIGEKPADVQYNVTVKLGTTGAKPTDADRGKPVKLGGDATYILCVDGDPIEGFITSIENHPANGLVVGTVRTAGYKEAITTATGLVIGDHVVAAAQAALGTYNDAAQFPRPKIKKALGSEAGPVWRIVSTVNGGGAVGAAGSVVVIERL